MIKDKFYIVFLFFLLGIVNVSAKNIANVKEFIDACGSDYVTSSGNTVSLTKDDGFSANNLELQANCNIDLDLSGNNLYYSGWSKKTFIVINKDATLTVRGLGAIYNKSKDNSTIWVNGGTLNISSQVYSTQHEAITVTNGGTINILDGADIYSQNSGQKSLRIETGTANFQGGTIRNTGGGVSISAYKNINNFLPVGYGIYKDGSLQNADVTQMSGELKVQPIEYKLTYNTDGGEAINESSYTVENYPILPIPVKKGYYFVGWTKSDGTPISSLEGLTGDISLKATWKLINYTLNFNTKGGTSVSSIQYTITSFPSLLESPTKKGYNFSSWHLNEDTSDKGLSSVPFLESSKEEMSITVYAKWTPEKYSISYELNGGDKLADGAVDSYTIESVTFNLPEPTKKDNAFKGWYSNKDFSRNRIEKIVSGSTGDKTFYAKWLQAYYITCHWYDGIVEKYSYTKEDKEYSFPSDKERRGYVLAGWLDNPNGTGTPVMSISVDKITSTDYYAKWNLVNYKITYNLNGGTNPDGIKQTYTIEDNDIKLPSPTRDGGTFASWFTDSNFSQPITTISKGTTGDKTLYAKWNLTTYTIKFDTKGGSSLGDVSYTIDTDNVILSTKSKKEGYTFAGWYKDETYTQSFGETISKGTSGNFTLYAKWNPVNYTIKYETYSDVEVPSSTYTIEQEVTLPVPQRSAYSFAGWYESDRLEGEPIMAIAKGTIGNKTLYAKWSAGSVVTISQGVNGTFTVKNGDKEIKSGEYVGPKTELTLTATPVAPYTLSKWVVNGKDVIGNPAKVEMPATNGLAVSAVFVDNRTAVSAPEIITTPTNTDKVPKGESVKVRLNKTDESAALYYSVDGAPDKAYNGEFLVSSVKDTLVIKAIARKTGFKDGVTTRQVVFDNNKITLIFDLPLGVKATNPTGGDVVSATVAGGSFEFKLTVDQSYYTNLDSMVVEANDSTIKAGASGIYTLTNCPSDVTVTVSGLKAKTSTVTLQQTENGKISFTDGAEETTATVDYGATVSITAVADEDFKFLQWNTGSQSNPLKLTVTKDTTISARFISDYKAYAITLPQLEGVTVKPFSGFTTEVKKDGTFKFYLQFANGYHEDNLVVRANGEELTKNKGGYAIYHINKNISISVEGIGRDAMTLKVPEHVTAKVVETMGDVTKQDVYGETVVLLHAEAPAGKVFTKWTDGKTDNPRLSTALDAAQLIPLFDDKGDESYAKVILNQTAGAGITGVNANLDAVKSGDVIQLKVVLLPAYSQSEVVLTADDQKLSPEVSLRAATDTKTYVYKLPVQKDGVAVKVSGLKLNTYDVTMAQTDGGTVSVLPIGKVTHGDKIQLKAQPASGMLFVKWWDGNTLNPYPYTVTSDTEVKAYFLGAESTVNNESIQKEEKAQITVSGQTLSVTVAEESMLYIWDYKGSLFRNQKIPAGAYTLNLPAGGYLVKVGDMGTRKIIIR